MSARIVGGVVPDPVHLALARRVLQHMVADEREPAARALAAVFDAGPVAVMTLISTTADTHIAAHERVYGVLPDDGEAVQPVWVNVDTGRVMGGADGVDPVWRWAGRYVAARAADTAQCEALIHVLRELSADAVVEHVAGLVQMCALAVRDARRWGARR